MIEVQAAVQEQQIVTSYHKKEHLYGDLAAITPIWKKQITILRKESKEGKEMPIYNTSFPQFSVLKTPSKCYYVLKEDTRILVYEIYPELCCYQFDYQVEPMGMIIINNKAYFLNNPSSVVVANLAEEDHLIDTPIPTIGRLYGLYTGYRANQQGTLSESDLVLKILHWNKGLEIFELYQEGTSWLAGILKFMGGLIPYERVVVLQPDVLGCAISNGSIKLINLATKNIIDTEFYIKFDEEHNVNAIEIDFCSRVPFLSAVKNSSISFLMSYFAKDSGVVRLYRVNINLQVLIEHEGPIYLDQLVGNRLLSDTGFMEQVSQIYSRNPTDRIKSVKLTDEGIYILYHKGHCDFRAWTNIIESYEIDTLDRHITKYRYEDTMLTDEPSLRNRLVMPGRFPLSIINNYFSENAYNQLSGLRTPELHKHSNELTRLWKTNYHVIELTEFKGYIFLIRYRAVSILLMTTTEEEFYYNKFVKETQNQRLHSQNSNSLMQSSLSRQYAMTNRLSQLSVNESPLDILADTQLTRTKVVPSLADIYSKTVSHLRDLLQTPLQVYQQDRGMPQTACFNIILSQLRSRLRVYAELLSRLYPYSREDISYNDKKAIKAIVAMNRIVNNSLPLYSRKNFIKSHSACASLDILSLFLLDQSSTAWRLDALEHLQSIGDSLLKRVYYGLVWLQSSPDSLSFDRMNQIIRFEVNLCEISDGITDYAEIVAAENSIATTPDVLKCCVLSEKIDIFKDRVFTLHGNVLQANMKKLEHMFKGSNDLSINRFYQKALSVLEALRMHHSPSPGLLNNLIANSSQNKGCKKAIRLLSRPHSSDMIEQEINEKLAYLQEKIEGPHSNIAAAIDELTSRNETRTKKFILFYRNTADHFQAYLAQRQLFKLQCILFNKLVKSYKEQITSEKVVEFIRTMKLTLEGCLNKLIQAKGLPNAQAESTIMESVDVRLYDQVKPKQNFLDILSVAQSVYTSHGVIPYDRIVDRVVHYAFLQTSDNQKRSQLLEKLLQYFQNREVAAEIIRKSKQSIGGNGIYQKIEYAAMSYAELAGQSERAEELMGVIRNFCSRRDIERQTSFSG